EQFDVPVIVRTTTRIAHSESLVELNEKENIKPPEGFVRDVQKFVMIPAYARLRHVIVEERLKKLQAFSEETPLQKIELQDENIGIITSGVSYQYAKEIMPDASFLKLGMTYPLPQNLIHDFADKVKELYVVEELDPFLESQIREMGINVKGLGRRLGELSPDILAEFFHGKVTPKILPEMKLPGRPPAMCPGCPHRSVFYMLKKKKLTVSGDIGCYTLSVLPPLEIMDTCVCMGASITTAMGIEKATKRSDNVVAVIGDSTFVHSGITGLVDMVYNNSKGTVFILDNETTAMTGRQDHPATGRTLMGEETKRLNLGELAKTLGVEYVKYVDPYDLSELESVIDEATKLDKLAVVITNRPCILLRRDAKPKLAEVDHEVCVACGLCLRLGCPAMSRTSSENKKTKIDPVLCSGCMVCAKICRTKAIFEKGN
ncbi:MAG: indolepyruvate ferredoxin oxidoreductase, alpha subunit, partial [Candidatus Poribacteria bacterium]|nr:indolepyruvate ferredoxin oxidoreductase, alpha subunit [Candidatus Poribacteria bacterium]